MGAVFSLIWGQTDPPDFDTPDEKLGLTPREIKDVRDVWAMILKKGVQNMGIRLFTVFFELYPDHQRFFKNFQDTPIEKLAENKAARAHVSNVMHSMSSIIEFLNDPDALIETLLKVGKNHQARKIGQQPFQDLKIAILEWMQRDLQNQFTPKRKESVNKTLDKAWSVIFMELTK